MKASFDGTVVRLGKDGRTLHEQGGYGRKEGEGISLSAEEALYLLHRGRIEIPGYNFDSFLAFLGNRPTLLRSFLVYRDIRERGYAIQAGPHDFRVFPRGIRPGAGESRYLVRVLSERDLIDFGILIAECTTSSHLRKQHLLAIVDDENELTYYEVRKPPLPEIGTYSTQESLTARLVGRSAVAEVPAGAGAGSEALASFGMRLDPSRLILSPLETLFLLSSGLLMLTGETGQVSLGEFSAIALDGDPDFVIKSTVYHDLRTKGYTPRTGYKFGHHFRVYTGSRPHSEMLIHAVGSDASLPMNSISRSVRLAHSVKKKMLFGCVHNSGIHYVEFARIKL
jgi:tRNA-intron endonuclease